MNTTPHAHLLRRTRRPRHAALLDALAVACRAVRTDPDLWPHYLLAGALLVAGIVIGWVL